MSWKPISGCRALTRPLETLGAGASDRVRASLSAWVRPRLDAAFSRLFGRTARLAFGSAPSADLSAAQAAKLDAFHYLTLNSRTWILRPILFTATVSGASWTTAEYFWIRHRSVVRQWRAMKRRFAEALSWPRPPPSYGARRIPIHRQDDSMLGLAIRGLRQRMQGFSTFELLMTAIIGVNVGVTVLWNSPALLSTRFMIKNFTHIHTTGLVRTLLTSAISHQSWVHLALNMTMFYSFSRVFYANYGPEYFLATLVSASAIASLADHLFNTAIGKPRMTLGASGCFCALFTVVALSYPDETVLFLMVLPAKISTILHGMVAFDLVGLTGLWGRVLPIKLAHAGHLGGVGAGYAIHWLSQRRNRKTVRNALPAELVQAYDRVYRAIML